MKKLISILLAVAMIISLGVPAFAVETEEPQYGVIKVEYSDKRGSIESLNVMIKDGFLYADAESFGSRLGCDVIVGNSNVNIVAFSDMSYTNNPVLIVAFFYDDTTVYYHPLGGSSVTYTAPAPCVQNEEGTWILLSYTLNLLGGSRNLAGDTLVVQMPEPSILAVANIICTNYSLLSFDWADDFGYEEKTINKMNGASRMVTLLNGLLEFDGSSWTCFVDWHAFDRKFGRSLSAMMCTYSANELTESIEEIDTMLDVFHDEGALGSILQAQKMMIDSDVKSWQAICEEQLKLLKAGSGTLPQYNMAYQQFERATRKQDLFAAAGGDAAMYIQDGLSEATDVLNCVKWIGYGVTYLSEFQQRDEFQASVLQHYFATRQDTGKLDAAAANSIKNYASSGIAEYTLTKIFENHLEDISDQFGLSALLGAPAKLLLVAWDVMSGTIPFYSEGLKAVEYIEISNYAQQLQNDAWLNFDRLCKGLIGDWESVTAEDCVQLAEYCYVYLKACHIARTMAIEYTKNLDDNAKTLLEGKVAAENGILPYIDRYLAILSRADRENSCYILGILPQTHEQLLENYSDQSLIDIVQPMPTIDYENLVTDAYSDVIRDRRFDCCYHIPQIDLDADPIQSINEKIHSDCYSILERDAYEMYDEIGDLDLGRMTYAWGVKDNLLSVVVEMVHEIPCYWTAYNVYTVSLKTGEEVGTDALLEAFGLTEDSYYDLVRSTIRKYLDERKDSIIFIDGESGFRIHEKHLLAEENVKNAIPYINADNELSIVLESEGYVLLNTVGDVQAESIECTTDHNADQPDTPHDALRYFIENCDSIVFEEADIQDFDKDMCSYARNGIYARSGRKFIREDLQEYYSQFDWYEPRIEPDKFSDDMLNRIQRTNLELIQKQEQILTRVVNISEEEAHRIAYDYWNYSPNNTSGDERRLIYEGMVETPDGKQHYAFRLKWRVYDSDGSSHVSTIDQVYINAETGECIYPW